MLTEILAEALAVTSDNLILSKIMFDCAGEATDELSSEARQRLGLVQTGLALAFEGLECDELQHLIQQAAIFDVLSLQPKGMDGDSPDRS